MSGANAGTGSNGGRKSPRSPAEWVTLLLSVAIVAAMFGAVVFFFFADNVRPAAISASVDRERLSESENGWLAPVSVVNLGTEPVESIRIEVTSATEEATITRDFEIPFLAGEATAEGIVVLPIRPTDADIDVQVISFRDA